MEKEEKKKEKDITELNIYEKMSAITNELGVVAKNLNVDMGNNKSYKAVQEKDVLDAVKPVEEKYRIYSYPKERKIIDSAILEKEGKGYITKNLYLRIETTYVFVNLDKPEESITMTSYADGIDSGDKATGKAMTYSDKYALLKAYKIATGDDPDKEGSPEKGYSKKITGEQIARITFLVSDIDAMLEYYKLEKLEDMDFDTAEQVIARKSKNENTK